jgi:hypothetical protein
VGRGARASVARKPLVTVLTCPRPNGVSYLEGTLDAIDAELGDHRRLLICDGPAPTARADWDAIVAPPRTRRSIHALPDNKIPGWMALEAAAHAGSDLLFCEDDIRPAVPGAFRKMASYCCTAQADFTTFFGATRRLPGIYKGRDFQLSQAVLLPRRIVQRLLAARIRAPGDWEPVTGIDIAIGVLANCEGMHFEQTADLVRHVGLWSAAMPGRKTTW